ncbi:MAG: BamA/TamA family outer membrane protein [Bacteroidales bacterium]|nr:BamA/TamA family outer membrane protein [Candidatus Liminaster caballi]
MLLFLAVLSGCRVTRHVPDGQDVLSRVNIEVDGKKSSSNTLRMAVAQKPYHRTFGFLPVGAWVWHPDTTSSIHRLRGKLGSEPPVYDEEQTLRTERAMRRALVYQGYLNAQVTHTVKSSNRKVHVTYHADRGLPYTIARIAYQIDDPLLDPLVRSGSQGLLRAGRNLDRTLLEEERTRVTSFLRDEGFYDFNKDDVSFLADTLPGSRRVDLTMVVNGIHNRYSIHSVRFVTNFDLVTGSVSGESDYLREKILAENCHIKVGAPYSEQAVRKTYSAFSRLHILKYVNIRFEQSSEPDQLDCTVYLSPQNPHAVQFELDGTNTSGDLGFAAAMTYQHRNLFRGSEAYTATLKGGYESLSGNVAGLVNDNYTEYSAENQIDFPRFLFPFLSSDTRRQFTANTAIKGGYSYQSRPEYTRIILQAGLAYKWTSEQRKWHHSLNVIDLSYVHLPKRSERFLAIIQNAGPISYNSYTSHLIMSASYGLYAGNQKAQAMSSREKSVRDLWTLRVSPEIGGNVLSALAHTTDFRKEGGRYQIFDLPFEQYARFDVDWTYSKYLTDRSRLAFHLAGGVAVPYGNSEIMPFEKRYYSGGANSVRGWSVRTLGPGIYRSANSAIDYFNQCGDVRFDSSVELRSRLFWKFEFAAFVDAGNVWTLRSYDSQPDGAISPDFYREIAASWGIGLRFVSDFFVIRLDMGVKAYDPTLGLGSASWVIDNPLSSYNRTIHFAVGYPF